jgi:hypothetical protein
MFVYVLVFTFSLRCRFYSFDLQEYLCSLVFLVCVLVYFDIEVVKVDPSIGCNIYSCY